MADNPAADDILLHLSRAENSRVSSDATTLLGMKLLMKGNGQDDVQAAQSPAP